MPSILHSFFKLDKSFTAAGEKLIGSGVYALAQLTGLAPEFSSRRYDAEPTLLRIRSLLKSGDFESLSASFASCASDEYSCRIAALADWSANPAFLHRWVDQMPSCAEAWLVRGAYKTKWAWEARGGDFSNSTSGFTFDVFFERLEEAEDDLNRAIDLVPANAEPYCYLLTSGMGLQISEEEMFARFTELKVRSPYHFRGHVAKLYSLTQRWGGSHEEMFQFAYDSLKEVPEGSGLHALVADAHIERWFEYVLDEGKAAGSLYIKSSNVRNDLKRAYEKSLGSPKYIPGGEDAIYRSYFAAAFYLSGQHTLASNEMDKLSKQIPEYPWALLCSRPWDITDAGYVVDRIQKQCSHRNIKR